MRSNAANWRVVFLIGLFIWCGTGQSKAQVPGIGDRPGQRQVFCNFGQPKPVCDVFPLAEFGYNLKMSGEQRSPYFDVDLGVMKNFTTRVGLGLTGGLGFGQGYVIAFEPRVRLWMTHLIGFEVAAGPVVSHGEGVFPSWTGQTGVNIGDRFSVVVQYDHLRMVGGGFVRSWFLSARVGLGGFVLSNFRGSDRTCRGRVCPRER